MLYLKFTLPIFLFLSLFPENTLDTSLAIKGEHEKLSPLDFSNKLKEIHESEGLEGSVMSVFVMEASESKPLTDYYSQLGMATASTMKAITTAAGMRVLGKDFTFKTRVEYDGEIDENGTLQGNLYIRGGGDPTLGKDNLPALLERITDKVRDSGINQINGCVVGDARIFDRQLTPDTWIWEDMGNYFGAGASGLSINENLYRLYFKTGSREGTATQITGMEPKIPGVEFVNEITTGKPGSGDNGYIFGAPYTYLRYVRGSLPPNYPSFMIKGSMPDPAYFCAYELQRYIEARGIEVNRSATTFRLSKEIKEGPCKVIWSKESPTLDRIITRTNMKSVNLYAEAILRMIGHVKKNEGSTSAGIEAMYELWESEGIDMKGCHFADGSGLSRFNAVNARQMVQILQTMLRYDTDGSYIKSLPIAGKTGTLKNMCKGRLSEGRIRAKSGYINRVRSYAGYADSITGKRLVFAIMINNYSKPYGQLTHDFEDIMDMIVRLGR
ncbi:D-alanyl-D-alanine carboxypeptidase/D-alanyl-D-alanine-endopeptidase [Flammeovirgaceae bacterium SG7u.111]|nr:D-alanyl-D-alanine carboxypeptidase/D-alanyl-D-alanine-endopeptidase [Flammeovirgaceae bacterium SG7u.132]WPO35053.1 D-alanyl-D-alanine carboxypeptidase/D-alanyl-D-alanine-endopeptidase [Flammeovirgaceae bacterium SG7u.111]